VLRAGAATTSVLTGLPAPKQARTGFPGLTQVVEVLPGRRAKLTALPVPSGGTDR